MQSDIVQDTLGAERADYGQVVLDRRLPDALAVLNPSLPIDALEDALRKLTRAGHRAGSTGCDDWPFAIQEVVDDELA